MSSPCVGYCGGHYPRRDMVTTDEGPFCKPCFEKLRQLQIEKGRNL